jgi:hypothetical protein
VTGEDVYRIWAPDGARWSPWVKPVLFTHLDGYQSIDQASALSEPEVPWAPDAAPTEPRAVPGAGYREPGIVAAARAQTALVVDLPPMMSICTGLALARRGYRPVPLYNSCPGKGAVVHLGGIMLGLRAGAPLLAELRLPPDAPPAFLLDANRMSGHPVPTMFDNRWMVLPQDLPSARLLRDGGVARVRVVRESGRRGGDDLDHVLRRWQDDGLPLELVREGRAEAPVPLEVARPRRYRALTYRLFAMLGLRRNAAGGFGSVVPEPGSAGG